jgi:hypothetical protein
VRVSDDTSKTGEQAAPFDLRVATATHKVRAASRKARGVRSDNRA